jgi:hypothetical protein
MVVITHRNEGWIAAYSLAWTKNTLDTKRLFSDGAPGNRLCRSSRRPVPAHGTASNQT